MRREGKLDKMILKTLFSSDSLMMSFNSEIIKEYLIGLLLNFLNVILISKSFSNCRIMFLNGTSESTAQIPPTPPVLGGHPVSIY